MPTPETPAQFIAKWSAVDLPERAASQEHFIDLCRLLGQPTPAEHDATGAEYTFEKGVSVTGPASRGSRGEHGFADAWWRGKFAWEYKRKGKYKDLDDAYRQLCQYREALENPPLLIVSDIARTQIHTNFTGTRKEVHEILLEQIAHPESLDKLRRVFTDPDSFKPTLSTYHLTENAAAEFAKIADQLRQRGHDPHDAAHFLMKCMFCMFAEDVGLLPKDLFSTLLDHARSEPDGLPGRLNELFAAMRDGGHFGVANIKYFNGGLFDDATALPLKLIDINAMLIAGRFDWGSVEPSIFGTLFERSLDPSKRSQIGAHYTSREDIMLIVDPVVMAPLRREWEQTQAEVEKRLVRRAKVKTTPTKRKATEKIEALLQGFQHRLAEVRILDPACGSGNFLYVAIQELLALEKEVIVFAAKPEIGLGLLPRVRPTQLHGIEFNPYAAELAQMVIWIGYLQWMRDNGFVPPGDPILAPLTTIECRDAILKWADEDGNTLAAWREGARCTEMADWPEADFVIGNPPFLGCRQFRGSGLKDDYIAAMQGAFDLPNTSDLCCYWFELGRLRMASGDARIGLLATQGIRGIDNREVLRRVDSSGCIFMAWADRPWVLDGADVRVSMIGFSRNHDGDRWLNGARVNAINADLSVGVDLSAVHALPENHAIAFMGDTKGGAFDITVDESRKMICLPNPNGLSNSIVVRPWFNAGDLVRRPRGMWIIDFGCDMPLRDASQFEAPFKSIESDVKPERRKNRRRVYAEKWWLHVEPRPAMRRALDGLGRCVATPRVAKHRIFVQSDTAALPDSRVFVFARSDNHFFGVVHSTIHELWTLRTCSWHGVGNDPTYNATTCFETFPLPWPPGEEDTGNSAYIRISEAVKELNEQRERWLNPPEWTESVARIVDARDDFADVARVSGEDARELIRQSAIMAEAARDPRLKKRTLTNLYNERPTWLRLSHEKLDRAVLAAYAQVDPAGEWSEDWAEVWVETGAGQPLPVGENGTPHELADRRAEIDQKVLANLLRLNLARAVEQ